MSCWINDRRHPKSVFFAVTKVTSYWQGSSISFFSLFLFFPESSFIHFMSCKQLLWALTDMRCMFTSLPNTCRAEPAGAKLPHGCLKRWDWPTGLQSAVIHSGGEKLISVWVPFHSLGRVNKVATLGRYCVTHKNLCFKELWRVMHWVSAVYAGLRSDRVQGACWREME